MLQSGSMTALRDILIQTLRKKPFASKKWSKIACAVRLCCKSSPQGKPVAPSPTPDATATVAAAHHLLDHNDASSRSLADVCDSASSLGLWKDCSQCPVCEHVTPLSKLTDKTQREPAYVDLMRNLEQAPNQGSGRRPIRPVIQVLQETVGAHSVVSNPGSLLTRLPPSPLRIRNLLPTTSTSEWWFLRVSVRSKLHFQHSETTTLFTSKSVILVRRHSYPTSRSNTVLHHPYDMGRSWQGTIVIC